MKNILVIGATSAIAKAVARAYASRGHNFCLMARNEEALDALSADLQFRGANQAKYITFDASDLQSCQPKLEEAMQMLGRIDIVLIAHGILPNQRACEQSTNLTQTAFSVNALSTVLMLTYLAEQLEQQGCGTIAVISSVAGDRGRQSNYTYGAAKAMLNVFLQGLRNRLFKNNVHVLNTKPGFVNTPMTAEFKKGLLFSEPEKIASGIIKAIEKKQDTVYLPWFWRYIMLIIKSIPESIFKRLSL